MRPPHHLPIATLAALLAIICSLTTNGCAQHDGRRGLPPPDKIELAAPLTVPMDSIGGRPVISARINQRGPYKLILDSGAAGSVFSTQLAAPLGLPALGHADMTRPGGKNKQPATLTKVDSIEIGELHLSGVSAVYADLSLLQTRLSPEIMGVLSSTMLDGLLVAFDYPAKKIGFRRGALPAADELTVFTWPAGERLPSVPVSLAGRVMRLDIDTGSTGGFTVPATLVDNVSWLETPVATEPIRTLDGTTPAALGRLQGEVRLGKFTFRDPAIRTNQGVLHLIGYQVLQDFTLTLDAKHRRFELRQP